MKLQTFVMPRLVGNISGGDPASEDAVTQNNLPTNDSEWADLLLIEMMSASSMDDAKAHIIRVFEHKVLCILVANVCLSHEEIM